MFGTNEIVGKKTFNAMAKDSLMITSMFFTLQGEGPYSGQPAVFIRLAKCNLNCKFCDTFFDDGDQMTFSEIEDNIDKIIKEYFSEKGQTIPDWVYNKVYHPDIGEMIDKANVVLVLTGGEPLLQENITKFMHRQLGRFKGVQVESNGILNTEVPEGVTLVCSPKCLEKDGVAVKYLAPSNTILNRADCLKFVMTADADSPYNTVPQWAHEWKKKTGKTIYCSPMNIYNDLPQKIKLLRAEKGNITMAIRSTIDEKIDFWEKGVLNLEENEKNHKYAAQYCMDNGFNLSLQMHLYAALA